MYKGKKILGITMARGGSKGIPRKNIKILAGKPLLAYTIEAGKNSRYLTRHIISSDDTEIMDVAKKHGGDVLFRRPAELALDNTPDIPVLQHAINWLKENKDEEYDYIIMLHPTAPLRRGSDIDACIEKIVETGADSVMSMRELTDFSMKKLKKIDNDLILPLLEDEGATTARRQDNPEKIYRRNCAIYLTKRDLIVRGDLFGKTSRAYIMPNERSIDINEPIDFLLAEILIKKQKGEL